MRKASGHLDSMQDGTEFPLFSVVLIDLNGVVQDQIGYRFHAPGANAVADGWNRMSAMDRKDLTAEIRPFEPVDESSSAKSECVTVYWLETELDGNRYPFAESMDLDTATAMARRLKAQGRKPKLFASTLSTSQLRTVSTPVSFAKKYSAWIVRDDNSIELIESGIPRRIANQVLKQSEHSIVIAPDGLRVGVEVSA